ncbi:PGF-CTERM sorting domain-containing protein [Haloarcula hispanica]|uniref:PGF-CTERM sorting domain-containing protein n=1 Tax=Haloarcula hispanica TaxID=51589 RepID=A0A5J5LLG7_HALHI|nr:BGTF surface domain-containing protein [Haloarcula hispanica]KAA9410233.1 PGF-CTERM sorting domain-containing protein [Haloarcula hispanica]
MTGNSDKVRSLFLTALMVFSVFAGTIAFSGGAAAAANVSVQQAVEYDDGTIELAFDGSAGSIGDGQVTVLVDGKEDTSASVGSADGSNGRLVINLDDDVTPNRNLTVKIANLPDGEGNNDETLVAEDIDVTSTTIDSYTSDLDRSYNINVYRGETVAVVNSTTGGNVFVEEDQGSIVSDDTYADNSQVYTLDTEDLDTGQRYNVSVKPQDDTAGEAGFKLSSLDLNVEADDNNITDEDDVIANVTITRGGQPANATLFDSDGDKVDTIIKDRLSGNEDTAFIFDNISSYEGFDADDGPYTINVTDNQTGVTASTDQINVSEAGDGDAGFENSVVTEEKGDVANITYQLDNVDEAVVFVGDEEDDNYAISGTIEDDDGDGEVTVSFNSYLAGTSGISGISASDILYVEGDDEITGVEESGSFTRSSLDEETIEASSYNLNVTAGTSQEDSADSVGTLRLSERSSETMRSWVAPQDAELDDDDIDIRDRIDQNLTQSNDIADGDLVVHQIVASGVEGPLAYEEEVNGSSSTTQAFLRSTAGGAGNNDAFNLTVNRSDVGANADQDPLILNSSNVVVVDDPDNNTYFVAVETQNAEFESGTQIREDDEDDELTANFTVSQDTGLSEDNDGIDAEYSIVDRDVTIDTTNGLVLVQAATDQRITGTTTVAPGSELEVEVESESESNPFLDRPEATVESDGTFTATADFSDYSAGTNFTTQALDVDGDQIGDEEDGQITDAETATVSINDQESDGSEVVIDSAQLSDGGFIAVHAGNASGDVVGNSEYLDAGSHEDITITLDEPMDEDFTAVAMPHLDTNGNEAYDFPGADGPYTANGSAVTDSANVTVGAEEPTDTPEEPTDTPEEPTDTPEEPTDTPEEPTDTATETTEAEGPGFTAAIALIALVAAALLAVRRNN